MIKTKVSILLSAMFFVVFATLFILSIQFSPRAMYFPFFVSLLGTIVALCNTILEYLKYREAKANNEEEEPIENEYDTPMFYNTIDAVKNFQWIIYYLIFIFLVGFIVGTALFLLIFLKFKTNFNWIKILLSIVITLVFILYAAKLMQLEWPGGILF